MQLARDSFETNDFKDSLVKLAEEFEQQGNLSLAEKIYLESKTPDKAIKMYKQACEWSNMIRLFEQFRPDHL
jgi:hypothetical protein